MNIYETARRLISAGIFAAGFCCLLAWTAQFLLPVNLTEMGGVESRDFHAVGMKAEPSGSLEVVFLGDSEMQTGVIPMELWKEYGITSYTCAQSGQRTMEAYYWLREILKTQKPNLVVLEADQFYHCGDKQTEFKTAIEKAAHYYFPAFKYHNQWKRWKERKGMKPVRERNYMKGYNYHDAVKPYEGGEYMTETDKQELSRPMVRFWLNRIMELCKKENIAVLFVGIPTPLNWNYARHNEVNEYALSQGVTFLDMNLLVKELQIDWKTDSMDGGDHLNLSGARKVTKYLGNYLKENYKLTDQRENPMYQHWNRDYEKYKEMVEKQAAKSGDF